MNLAQVGIGGKDVLIPVTTIGSLATGAAVTSTLQPWRSLESGCSSSQHGSLSVYEPLTSPDLTSQSSIGSDEDGFTNAAIESRSVQEVFTKLIEAYDQQCEQQRRAMNNLWSYYASHADELEACAPELEALLCSKHVSAQEQSTSFMRVSTSPSQLSQQQSSNTNHVGFDDKSRWNFLHRRSRSMS